MLLQIAKYLTSNLKGLPRNSIYLRLSLLAKEESSILSNEGGKKNLLFLLISLFLMLYFIISVIAKGIITNMLDLGMDYDAFYITI